MVGVFDSLPSREEKIQGVLGFTVCEGGVEILTFNLLEHVV